MSNPSLLCVPYRFKTSKLYSQIPDSGLGDFTVTRTTTPTAGQATRVNAAGLIELVADNVPRLDYPLGGITAGCPALLVEPSAQNLALRSAELDNAVWTNALWGNWSNATAASSTTIAPDGSTNAEELTFTTNTSSRLQRITGIAASTTYTFSMYVMGKAGNSYQNGILLRISTGFNNALVTVAAATSRIDLTVSNTIWTRYSVTFTTPSSGVNEFNVGITVANSGINPNATMICWGAQLETGSVATSYIPTAASPVTRGAEVVDRTGISSLMGQTEGTFYLDMSYFAKGASGTTLWLYIVGTPTSNNIGLAVVGTSVRSIVNGQSDILSTPSTANGVKIAWGYDGSGVVCFVNGVQYNLPNGGNQIITSMNRCIIDMSSAGGTRMADVRIRAVELYPTRLPNTGPNSLQSLTQ